MMTVVFMIPQAAANAQDDSLTLIDTAVYDIGFDCPVTSTLSPDGTILWILMDNCGDSRRNLQAFNVADGTKVNEEDYAEALAPLDAHYIDHFTNPLAFTPDGDLSIRYIDPDTYESSSIVISLADGDAEITFSEGYNTLLSSISEYPESSVYNADHTRVAVASGSSIHILDVQEESEVVEIEVEGGTDYAFPSFSADGSQLHLVVLNNPDDFEDNTAALFIYALPDGEQVAQYDLPSFSAWVSPNGQYAALILGSNNIGEREDLFVMELESGRISPALSLLEEPTRVLTCANRQSDLSDLNIMTDAYYTAVGIRWLQDSSGFLLPLSYGGDGLGGGELCLLDYSRLRSFAVEDSG